MLDQRVVWFIDTHQIIVKGGKDPFADGQRRYCRGQACEYLTVFAAGLLRELLNFAQDARFFRVRKSGKDPGSRPVNRLIVFSRGDRQLRQVSQAIGKELFQPYGARVVAVATVGSCDCELVSNTVTGPDADFVSADTPVADIKLHAIPSPSSTLRASSGKFCNLIRFPFL